MLANLSDLVTFINARPGPMAVLLSGGESQDIVGMTPTPGVYECLNLSNVLRGVTIGDKQLDVREYPVFDEHQVEWDRVRALRDAGSTEARIDHELFTQSDIEDTDDIEQILTYFADRVADPTRAYVIGLLTVRKATQPDRGGWRWHRWGEYIGVHEPQREYIHDEPVIEQAICFHLLEVPDFAPGSRLHSRLGTPMSDSEEVLICYREPYEVKNGR